MIIIRASSTFILMFCLGFVFGQHLPDAHNKMEILIPKKSIVCYKATGDAHTNVPPPASYLAWKKNTAARSKSASFIVTYDGFSPEAKLAFQKAVDIWETLIISSVPIRISASWKSLQANVLGSATPTTYVRNFDGAQKVGIWYPIALAEKIAHKELNGLANPDIIANFNSDNTNWNFNTNGTTSAGNFDMVSVVLHEIGHGLGITHSYEISGANGGIQEFFSGTPVIFEAFLENQASTNLVTGFQAPSTSLATQLTGSNLFLNSTLVKVNNNNLRGIVFAPATYSAGSSIAHLDENSYPKGDKNSLMTPSINSAEAIHNPGPVIMGILKDMGWNNILIQHTPLRSTEDLSSDYTILCQLKSDTIYDASTFKLFFTSDGVTFTSKPMMPTLNPNEFQSFIPTTGSKVTYGYYLSLTDKAQRVFVKPGKKYSQGKSSIDQSLHVFTAGPDTSAPHITHSPKGFIQNTETSLKLEVIVTDNLSVKKVVVEYLINDVAQVTVDMLKSPDLEDSIYSCTIPLTASLLQGDKIKYRIIATDNAVAQNPGFAPSATGYYSINVVSLAPLQDSYSNNFNSLSTDLFGDAQFSITTPSGFNDGAIHSVHPYPNGTGANFESNFVYQLRVPIKLKPTNATIKFDEIVLVEASDAGAIFGSKSFYDYVVVEGSKDGGITWKPFADGFNARSKPTWLTKWMSSSDTETQPNSTAIGDPSLFSSHTIDMLANKSFITGDEVVIRFRLFADQLVHGWGWAIDNLKIQIDETAPVILHSHSDFLISNATNFKIESNVKDAGGLKDLSIEYSVNNGAIINLPQVVTTGVDQYIVNFTLSGLLPGDEIQYRINAMDVSNNSSALPASGFFHVTVVDFSNPLTTYVSDFNTTNTDFTGNFFTITNPTGFADAAIHSSHPYANGFGLDNTSGYQFMLKKPIVVDASNPIIAFSEIVLTEFSGAAVKDFVVVEGSKDNGATWQSFVDPYSANANASWIEAFNSSINGHPLLFKNRQIDITKSGKFKAGDVVLFRFRLMADAITNGWGWAIDNLSIQGPITGLENTINNTFKVYPNPIASDYFTIQLSPEFVGANIAVINLQGQAVADSIYKSDEEEQKIFVGNLADGMYLVKVNYEAGVLMRKIIVKR